MDFPSLFTLPFSRVAFSHISPLSKPLTPPPQSSFLFSSSQPFGRFSPSSLPSSCWNARHTTPLPHLHSLPADLIQSQGFEHQLFVYNFQMYISCPAFSVELQTCTSNCLFDFSILCRNLGFLTLGTTDSWVRIILCGRRRFSAL